MSFKLNTEQHEDDLQSTTVEGVNNKKINQQTMEQEK